jgi:hypothetical protein
VRSTISIAGVEGWATCTGTNGPWGHPLPPAVAHAPACGTSTRTSKWECDDEQARLRFLRATPLRNQVRHPRRRAGPPAWPIFRAESARISRHSRRGWSDAYRPGVIFSWSHAAGSSCPSTTYGFHPHGELR